MFDDLMKGWMENSSCYGKPDVYEGKPIQGKIIVITPVYYYSLDFIHELLNDVSRSDDILLRTRILNIMFVGLGVPNEVDLDENGLLTPNIPPRKMRDCPGIHPSEDASLGLDSANHDPFASAHHIASSPQRYTK
jgi:hypothetical protein